MNIFDQYGIKEVADVVLYDIELDKHDNEIYVPIMYFDTLKVSTIEESAESTSARGGYGNPELIAWDFGKEITVNLEDALYTPASQSLMWGGKFGVKKTKIYGVWNPYVYEKDSFGRPVYTIETEVNEVEVGNLSATFHVIVNGKPMHFNAPIQLTGDTVERMEPILYPDYGVDPSFVWYEISPTGIRYQYTLVLVDGNYYLETSVSVQSESSTYEMAARYEPIEVEENLIYYICPCDAGVKWVRITPAEGHYKYYRLETQSGDWGEDHWQEDQLIPTDYRCPSDNPVQESEEIERIVQKYAIEENLTPDIAWADSLYPERAHISIDAFGDFEFHAYEFLTKEDIGEQTEVCYYSDIDMCQTGQDVIKCSSEKIDAYGYIWKNSDIKIISLEGEQDVFFLEDMDVRYRIRTDNRLQELAIEYSSDHEEGYYAKINVYKHITFRTLNDNGLEDTQIQKILAGTFYIIDDWNQNVSAPQDNIYEINHGLENVDYLERMEKIVAETTFAIDADKNILCNNYRYMKDYDHTELTVFLNPKTMKPYEANASSYLRQNGQLLTGNFVIIKQGEYYCKWSRSKAPQYASLGHQVIVTAEDFPGTYRLVGETYARARSDGQDQRFQFEIPLGKLIPTNSLVLEAEGDPTTFSMQFKVLRRDDGVMMKLTQYDVEKDGLTGSTKVAATERLYEDKNIMELRENDGATVVERWGPYRVRKTDSNLEVINPTDETVIYIDEDEQAPFGGVWSYVSKISAEDLAQIVNTEEVPIGEGTAQTLTNETLSIPASEIVSTYIVVKQQSDYQVDRLYEQVVQYQDGSYGPVLSSEWIYQRDITTNHYLNPTEYNYDLNGNITLV